MDLENKKSIIVETPSDDKENEMVPLGKLLAERGSSGGGGGAASVGKANNKGLAERSNSERGGVGK